MKALFAGVLTALLILFGSSPLFAEEEEYETPKSISCAVALDEPAFPEGFFDGDAWRANGRVERISAYLTKSGIPQNLWLVAPGAVKVRDRSGEDYWRYGKEQSWAVLVEDTTTGAKTLLFERKLKDGLVKAQIFDTGAGNHVRITVIDPQRTPTKCDVAYTSPGEFIMTQFVDDKLFMSEGHYQNGKLNGKWREQLDGGLGLRTGQFQDGKRAGLWIEWNLQAEFPGLASLRFYRDDMEEGIRIKWSTASMSPSFTLRELGVVNAGLRQGLWTKWDADGKLTEQTHYIDGKRNGTSVEWRDNGITKAEGSYREDKREGLWTEWFENGNPKLKCHFHDGLRDGTCAAWRKNGQKSFEGVLRKVPCSVSYKGDACTDSWSGTRTDWYKNGALQRISSRSEGMTGISEISWHDTGVLKAIRFWMPGIRQSIEWYEDGRLESRSSWVAGHPRVRDAWDEKGHRIVHVVTPDSKVHAEINAEDEARKVDYWRDDAIQDGFRIGLSDSSSPFPRRKIAEGQFVGGRKVGRHVGYFDTGQRAWVRQYKDGQLNGREVAWYYPRGRRLKTLDAFYVADRLEGRKREWYANGRLQSVAFYHTGEPFGTAREWYENGRLKRVERYRNGRLHGIWREWSDSGQPSAMHTYREGRLHGRTIWWTYGENGRQRVEKFYQEGEEKTVAKDEGNKVFSWDFRDFKEAHCFPMKTVGQEKRCLNVVRYPNMQIKEQGVFLQIKIEGLPRPFSMSDGPWQFWYESGLKKAEGAFNRYDKTSLWTEYYKNGIKRNEVVYLDGDRNGLWTEWYNNGELAWKGSIINDEVRIGPWVYWYENGEKRAEGSYDKLMRNGPWVEYYDNGHKRAEGSYVRDRREGEWHYWDRAGQPIDHMLDEDWQPEVE